MPAVRQIGRRRFAWNLPLNEVRWTRSSPRTGGVLHAYPSIAKAAWQSRLSGSFYWPLPIIVFALNRSAIHDVVVNGRFIVRDKKHVFQDEIISRYKETHQKVWRNTWAGDRS